jgi:hypothetical protein
LEPEKEQKEGAELDQLSRIHDDLKQSAQSIDLDTN